MQCTFHTALCCVCTLGAAGSQTLFNHLPRRFWRKKKQQISTSNRNILSLEGEIEYYLIHSLDEEEKQTCIMNSNWMALCSRADLVALSAFEIKLIKNDCSLICLRWILLLITRFHCSDVLRSGGFYINFSFNSLFLLCIIVGLYLLNTHCLARFAHKWASFLSIFTSASKSSPVNIQAIFS